MEESESAAGIDKDAVLVAALPRFVRCAIYTRQSVNSEDGLSSCQVQFEACEAFVLSQRSQGWILLERFDDDGYSGATSDRPALQHFPGSSDIDAWIGSWSIGSTSSRVVCSGVPAC